MLTYNEKYRQLSSSHGFVKRKKDGLVLRCPVHISVDETPEDYEEYTGKRASQL